MHDDITLNAKVAIYVRCSTTGQENSIADQLQSIQLVVKDRSLQVVETYKDEGISGSSVAIRPELIRLLSDAKQHKFEYVLVYDSSRWTRGGNSDFWHLYRELRECRVRLYSCHHRLVVTESNGIFFSVDATTNRAHNVNHARDITRSIIQNITTRKCDPGRIPPYGYDRLRLDEAGKPVEQIRYMPDGSKQVLDPATQAVRMVIKKGDYHGKVKSHRVVLTLSCAERVAVVKRILNLAKSMGFTRIADTLNREHIPCPSGNLWSNTTIKSLVENPAYYGEVVYNRTQKSLYYKVQDGVGVELDELDQGHVNFAKKDPSQWIITENAHPALITKEEFCEIQAAIKRRDRGHSRGPRSRQHDYLLSGSLYCGRCGSPLQGHTVKSNKLKSGPRHYRRYTCSNARKHGSSVCARYSFNAEEAEKFALQSVRCILESPQALEKISEGLEAQLAGLSGRQEQASRLVKQLAALEAKKTTIFNSLDAQQQGFMKKQIDSLMAEEQELNFQLAEVLKAAPAIDKKVFIAKAVKYFREQVLALNGGCRKSLREVLRALGVRLVYDPDKKEGVLKLDPFGQPSAA